MLPPVRSCRVFRLASIINIRRGLARGRCLATATARACDASDAMCLLVCLYEVPTAELPDLLARERRLHASCVPYEEAGGSGEAGGDDCDGRSRSAAPFALMFAESSDEEYFRERCGGDPAVYREEVGQFYDGALYRDDLLPVPTYVLRCLEAARKHATDPQGAVANLLDTSFLGDGQTTLRTHLASVLESSSVSEAQPGGGWTEEERARLAALFPS